MAPSVVNPSGSNSEYEKVSPVFSVIGFHGISMRLYKGVGSETLTVS